MKEEHKEQGRHWCSEDCTCSTPSDKEEHTCIDGHSNHFECNSFCVHNTKESREKAFEGINKLMEYTHSLEQSIFDDWYDEKIGGILVKYEEIEKPYTLFTNIKFEFKTYLSQIRKATIEEIKGKIEKEILPKYHDIKFDNVAELAIKDVIDLLNDLKQ